MIHSENEKITSFGPESYFKVASACFLKVIKEKVS